MTPTFDILESNLKLNNIKNATAHNIGLSNSNHNCGVFYDSSMSGATYITTDTDLINNNVQCSTLDSFNFNNVSFIKMDIQRAETKAIEGAKQTLLNNDCALVAEYEISSPELIKEYEEGKKLLSSLGYYPEKRYGKDVLFIKKK